MLALKVGNFIEVKNMFIKKTRSELKEMALGWKNNIVDFVKKQEAWKILVGGIVLGGALVLFIGLILPLVFFAVVISAVLYFMAPESIVTTEVNDDSRKE